MVVVVVMVGSGGWCPFCASFFPERGQIPLEHDPWLERQAASFICSDSMILMVMTMIAL